MELSARRCPGPSVRIPLEYPLSNYFTATPRRLRALDDAGPVRRPFSAAPRRPGHVLRPGQIVVRIRTRISPA